MSTPFWQVWLGQTSNSNPAGSGSDASINSNVLKQTYINRFLDVSGTLTVRYDASINGNLYLAPTSKLGIGIKSPVYTLDQIGTHGIKCPDSASYLSYPNVNPETYGIILTTSKSTPFTKYTMGLGIDYSTGYGYINTGYTSSDASNLAQPLLLQTTGGDVGIGNLNPTAALFVVGNQNKFGTAAGPGGSTFNSAAYYGNNGIAGNTIASFVNVIPTNTGTTNSAVVEIGALNRDIIPTNVQGTVYKYALSYHTNSTGSDLEIKGITTGANFQADGTPVSRVYITASGNIGMGITNPQYNLDVSGTARFSSDVSINGNLVVRGTFGVQQLQSKSIINTTTTNYQLIVSEDISLNGRLFVSGDVSLNSRVFIGGDISMGGRLLIGGDISMGGRLLIGGERLVIGGERLVISGDVSLNSRLIIGGDIYQTSYSNDKIFVIPALYSNLSVTTIYSQVVCNSGYGYISTNAGLYRTSDYGATWTLVNSTLVTSTPLAVSQTLFADNTGQYVQAFASNSTVYISTNYGVTFTAPTELGGSFWAGDGAGFCMNGAYGYVVWSQGRAAAAYRTINYGQTWTQVTTPPFINQCYGTFAITDDGTKYLKFPYTLSNLYVSTDYGNTWTTLTGVAGGPNIGINSNAQYIVRASAGNVHVSSNSGTSFTTVAVAGVTGSVSEFIYVSSDGSIMTVSNNYSTNYGVTWTNTTQALYVAQNLSYTLGITGATVKYGLSVKRSAFFTGAMNVVGDVSMGGNLAASSGTTANTYKNVYGKAPPTTIYEASFMPNTIDASGRTTWVNKNVTWTATASSNSNAFTSPYTAFIPNSNLTGTVASGLNLGWTASTASYNGTTGTPTGQYNAGVYYTTIQNATAANSTLAVSGEWLQIQSSVPVVMTSFNFSTGAFGIGNSASRLPYKFYICGSNDNNNWSPIVYGVWASLPIASGTQLLIPTSTYVINGTNSLTSNTNYVSTASTSPDNKLNYITYGNNSTPYSAFRVVVQSVIASNLTSTAEGTSSTVCFLFNPRFSVTTQTGPSRTLLYMDPLNINQLDVSGSLAFINSNLPTILTVTPNTTGVASNAWSNNNVSWVSSASSINGTAWESFKAFNGIHNSDEGWHDGQPAGYTATAGGSPANSNFQTPVFATGTSGTINTYNGQWLQIQANIPLVIKTFYFGSRNTQPTRLPQIFYIVGSNTGTGTWTPIFKGTTTSTTGALLSGTVSLSGLGASASGTISNFYGSTALTYDNTYGNTASSFTYFRLIVNRICATESTCNIGEWGLTFDKVATTTTINSSVSLALDNVVPNQLNVGGALGIAGGITPIYSVPSFGPGQVGYTYETAVSNISVINATDTNLLSLTVMPGVYIVEAHARCNPPSANTVCYLYLKLNGAIVYNGYSLQQFGSTAYNNSLAITTVVPVTTPNSVILTQGYTNAATHNYGYNILRATRIA